MTRLTVRDGDEARVAPEALPAALLRAADRTKTVRYRELLTQKLLDNSLRDLLEHHGFGQW